MRKTEASMVNAKYMYDPLIMKDRFNALFVTAENLNNAKLQNQPNSMTILLCLNSTLLNQTLNA